MRARVELLAAELDGAYRLVRARVDGLSDDEFWWEPVADAWTIRPTRHGTWTADYEEPDPDPAPFTTIGWRLVHVAECKRMYHEYAFGDARLTWPELDSPHTAADAVAALDDGHLLLVEAVGSLDDDALDRRVLTNWGERWPAWRIFWTMIHHDLWHGGEIGALRDLYRWADAAGILPAQRRVGRIRPHR
jgi:DinB family protein